MRTAKFGFLMVFILIAAAGCAREARKDWGRAIDNAGEAIKDDAQYVKGKAKTAGKGVKRTVKELVDDDTGSGASSQAGTLDCTDPGVRAAAAPGECYN